MFAGFELLNEEENHLLMDAPALVAILIGAADGNFDREERFWSEKMLKARTLGKPDALESYNIYVAEQFWARKTSLLRELPQEVKSRGMEISARLGQLNEIFKKLDPETSGRLYKGLLRLASETARSSGGFLRFGALSKAEAQWVELPMIIPVPIPPEPEWEEENPVEEA